MNTSPKARSGRPGKQRPMFSKSMRAEWGAHWHVVLGTFFGMALAYPSWIYVQSQFVKPLQAEFGWTRAEISFAFGLNLFISFCAPLYGRLVDRFGVRPVLLTSMVFLVAAYVLLANATGNYTAFLGSTLLMLLAGMGSTGVTFTRAVASWFEVSRGTALAVSRIGMSIFGAVMPILVFHVIADYGWRAGFYVMAAICALVALPASFLWVRDRRPDKLSAEGRAKQTTELKAWGKLLMDRRVLFICLAAAFTYAPTVGVLTHLQPLLTSKAIDPSVAANLGSLLAISVLIGILTTGLLVDRVWAPLVGCLYVALPIIGCVLLLTPAPTIIHAGAAIMLIGLAQGAEIDVVAYMVARYFGMRLFGAIYGMTVFAISISVTIAGVAFGWVFDKFGTYDPALIGAAVVFGLGSLCYLLVGKYPERRGVRGLEDQEAAV